MQPFGEDDLYAAVAAGAITPEGAARLQHFLATRVREVPTGVQASAPGQVALAGPDDEAVHFLTGFNDVFVSIAVVLTLLALSVLVSYTSVGSGNPEAPVWMGVVCVAGASWGLAEYFTRRRRMALPSILLMLGFVLPVGSAVYTIVGLRTGGNTDYVAGFTGIAAVMSGFAAGTAAAVLHWWRFGVPVTVAVGMVSVLAVILAALHRFAPGVPVPLIVFACGLVLFAAAIWWDMRDPMRRTVRSDVAFWLHLASAPLLVQPAFAVLGFAPVTPWTAGPAGAFAVPATVLALLALGLYALLAVVALVLDRRALLASALAYVLYAVSTLFSGTGLGAAGLAVTGLLVGAGLLLLSAFWAAARGVVLPLVPAPVRARLPPAR